MVCLVVQAQSLQVSGTIVSKSDGQPIIGATILEQGTTNGTITDFDGKFSLTVKQGAEISISYWTLCWKKTQKYWMKLL